MAVKKIQLISVLLYIINFLIIQPSLVLCDETDLRIFGIKVGVAHHDGPLTSGQKTGYTILNWVLSGLGAIAVLLVLICLICSAVCCNQCFNRDKNTRNAGTEEEIIGTGGMTENERYEGNEENEGNEGNEGNVGNVRSERDDENDGNVHAR